MIKLPEYVTLKKKSDSWHQKVAGKLTSPFNKRYMESYWTTLGSTIYVPTRYDNDKDWGSQDWINRHEPVIAHELVHVDQSRRWTVFVQALLYLGPSPFLAPVALAAWIFSYPLAMWLGIATLVLLPLSIGLAYGRWRIEREAYQVSRSYGRYHVRIAHVLWTEYLMTWPKSWAVKWFEDHPVPHIS
jgi:hypothetical protein